jgi:hypothetical protein
MAKFSKYYCPWCETAKLEFIERTTARPLSNGVYLGCSKAQTSNCPDTTGICATEAEAEGYAAEFGCKEEPSTEWPDSGYQANAVGHQSIGNHDACLLPSQLTART